VILLDLNQVMFSTLFASLGKHTNLPIEEDLLRHMAMNTIRALNVKFRNEYGELVIAADSKKYWRREYFPHYKASRRKSRNESDLDWKTVFECLHSIKNDLREVFPYKYIEIEGAEADDVIAVLAKHWSIDGQKVLVVSGDKDFKQLQKHGGVSQYDPVMKRWISSPNPVEELQEHILKGDIGDGIPNVLSPGDTFVEGKRQKALTAKARRGLVDVQINGDHKYYNNFERNRKLIDFDYIPNDIQTSILKEYFKEKKVDKSKLMMYFSRNKMGNLLESLNDF
jgi:hypothetical protein